MGAPPPDVQLIGRDLRRQIANRGTGEARPDALPESTSTRCPAGVHVRVLRVNGHLAPRRQLDRAAAGSSGLSVPWSSSLHDKRAAFTADITYTATAGAIRLRDQQRPSAWTMTSSSAGWNAWVRQIGSITPHQPGAYPLVISSQTETAPSCTYKLNPHSQAPGQKGQQRRI